MNDVASDLMGEIVEVRYLDGNGLRSRGAVRAVHANQGSMWVLVEDETDNMAGRMILWGLWDYSVRVVQYCRKCCTWDRKRDLDAYGPVAHIDTFLSYEHKAGKGCKAVGHGG